MLFLPVGETDITTSTLLPQRLQSFAEFFASDLADTSVFDFTFPAIVHSSFHLYTLAQEISQVSRTHSYCAQIP